MKFFQLQSEVGVKLQLHRYAKPLKKLEMRYAFKRILLKVFTTLKSIFNEKKKSPLPTSAGFGKGVFISEVQF